MGVIGGPDELEAVFQSERQGLLRLAYLMSGSRELAEDAVQAAFTTLVQHRASVDEPARYLKRAVANQVKGVQRRSYRVARRWTPPPVTDVPEVDEAWAEIQRLPVRQRQVVVLRFYEDLSLVDIAKLLDTPAGTVRSDLHRALATLKRRLT